MTDLLLNAEMQRRRGLLLVTYARQSLEGRGPDHSCHSERSEESRPLPGCEGAVYAQASRLATRFFTPFRMTRVSLALPFNQLRKVSYLLVLLRASAVNKWS